MGWFEFFNLTPGRDRFAATVRAQLLRARPEWQIEYNARKFRLKVLGQPPLRLPLEHAYRAYCAASRAERDQVVARYAGDWLAWPELAFSFERAAPRLMPVVRPRALLGWLDQDAPGIAPPLAYELLAEDAVRALALDGAATMQMVTPTHLAQWGVSFERAFAVALENLDTRSPEQFTRVGGVLVGQWGDSYASSRVFLADLAQRALGYGAAVAMVPARDTLLLAPAHDPATQGAMINLAREIGCRSGSTRMFGFAQGVPVPYEPLERAVAANLRALQVEQLQADYRDQKEQLDAFHARTGKDIVVATFDREVKDGAPVSICTWTAGQRCLLPQTDYVLLARAPGAGTAASRMVRWETLRKGAAHLMNELPGYPVRYAVARFPDALFEVAGDAP